MVIHGLLLEIFKINIRNISICDDFHCFEVLREPVWLCPLLIIKITFHIFTNVFQKMNCFKHERVVQFLLQCKNADLTLGVAANSDWLLLWRGLLICKINEKASQAPISCQLDQAGQKQLIIPIPAPDLVVSTTILIIFICFSSMFWGT